MNCNNQQFLLTCVRGDNFSFTIELQNEDGTAIPFQAGDVVRVSAKKNISDPVYAFQKVIDIFDINKAQVNLIPEDTKNMEEGDYFYDVQLKSGFDGRITTLIPISVLTIIPEITTNE